MKTTLTDLAEPIAIGSLEVRNRVLLAPMSGVSDLPFRDLAWEFGAGSVFSEMIASHSLMAGEELMLLKLQKSRGAPHVVQLAGREAKWMARAAEHAEAHGAELIDINMGCPAKKVTSGYSGSALMRDLDHAMTLVEATVGAVSVPVTLKMRLGWDEASINAPELARRAVDSGVQAVTVHGRTRCQFYKGHANWELVNKVRDVVDVPLFVNGDIFDNATAAEAMKQSGADGVMLGRSTYGRPWLPGLVAGAISPERAIELGHDVELVIRHHESMTEFYGLQNGLRQARKHLGWYIDNLDLSIDATPLKRRIMTSFDVLEIYDLLRELFSHAIACERLSAA